MTDSTRTITLTNGGEAIVDADDFARLAAHKWRRNAYGYAVRAYGSHSERHMVWMHREVLSASGLDTDHVNGNRLDNRRSNLRTASRSQNLANSRKHRDNTSGYKGVYWSKKEHKWIARICVNYKTTRVGAFDDVQDAARAYNAKALELVGEFARLNEIVQ